jgi:hypothetical protein
MQCVVTKITPNRAAGWDTVVFILCKISIVVLLRDMPGTVNPVSNGTSSTV